MKFLKILIIGLAVIAALYLGFGAMLPSDFKVETDATFNASTAEIHPWVNDLKKWPEWTVWSQSKDDKPVISYGETTAGVGAHQKWEAPKSGKGELTVTASDPGKGIAYSMFFIDGEEKTGPAKCKMDYSSAGEGKTKVSWTMAMNDIPIHQRPIFKLFALGMIKTDFDGGLANLKKKIEAK